MESEQVPWRGQVKSDGLYTYFSLSCLEEGQIYFARATTPNAELVRNPAEYTKILDKLVRIVDKKRGK